MPPKRGAVPDPQPATSSTSSSESEEEESSGTPPPQENPSSKKPKLGTPSTDPPPQTDDDEEESGDEEEDADGGGDANEVAKPTTDSESESESEGEPTPQKPLSRAAADPTVKPINSKFIKPSSTKPTNPTASPQKSVKDEKDSKGKRKASDLTGSKSPFTRIWNDDDEIAVLNGMVEFMTSGKNATVDKDAFHEFMKKSLRIEVSRNQLMEKIARLKKKFRTNLKKKGGEPNFSKLHEKVVYDLSKRIWGKSTVAEEGNNGVEANGGESAVVGVKPSAKQRNAKEEKLELVKTVLKNPTKSHKAEEEDVVEHLIVFSQFRELLDAKFDERLLKKGFNLMESSRVKILAERLKKLRKMEAAFYKERAALMNEQMALMADAIIASDE